MFARLDQGGSAAIRARSARAVKVSIALTGVENLSRTPQKKSVAAATTPRKALADSLIVRSRASDTRPHRCLA